MFIQSEPNYRTKGSVPTSQRTSKGCLVGNRLINLFKLSSVERESCNARPECKDKDRWEIKNKQRHKSVRGKLCKHAPDSSGSPGLQIFN